MNTDRFEQSPGKFDARSCGRDVLALLKQILIDKRREDDQDRLDAVENKMNDEGWPQRAGVCTRKCQRETEDRDDEYDAYVVRVLQHVDAGEEQRYETHRRAFAGSAFER